MTTRLVFGEMPERIQMQFDMQAWDLLREENECRCINCWYEYEYERERRTGGVEEEKSGAGSIDDHNAVVVLAT